MGGKQARVIGCKLADEFTHLAKALFVCVQKEPCHFSFHVKTQNISRRESPGGLGNNFSIVTCSGLHE